jgi:hypothetical protein
MQTKKELEAVRRRLAQVAPEMGPADGSLSGPPDIASRRGVLSTPMPGAAARRRPVAAPQAPPNGLITQ